LVLVLGLGTLLVFGAGGVALITLVQGRDLFAVLSGTTTTLVQVGAGLAAGAMIGAGALALIRRPSMRALDERFAQRIGPRVLRVTDRVFLSICAGVGEELFFRGALQFWLGVPLTALLFVAIHGYLDPRDRRMLVYGAYMTAAMMGLGLMVDRFGLIAPMLAHTVIDVLLFRQLVRTCARSQAQQASPLGSSLTGRGTCADR
jgi:hypothetical protein